ncbi:hypothetical protein J2S74_003059 [Evansella vedderi]|uniref:Group-specific protein n=1 Tax=Evansella vedderi TaxID=38282 RepID=A0ABT9ZWR7_9BACI|nr:hypothetical protein [Evansella vedderi]MDQ0255677.1 hypothetical protein [Evansella vedderi]
MGECKLDHSLEDVRKKLQEQASFLSKELYEGFTNFLDKDLSQQELNEAFHLLKKYDLSSKEEQEVRNEKMKEMFQQ